jgi:hypothetical protein
MSHSKLQFYTQARRAVTRSTIALAVFTLIIASGILCAVKVGAAGGDVDMTFATSVNGIVLGIAYSPTARFSIVGALATVNGVHVAHRASQRRWQS